MVKEVTAAAAAVQEKASLLLESEILGGKWRAGDKLPGEKFANIGSRAPCAVAGQEEI